LLESNPRRMMFATLRAHLSCISVYVRSSAVATRAVSLQS
jgi:hypothetical protein